MVVHTFHGHVLRGYFGTGGTLVFRAIETLLARASDRLIAVSPEVRDELVALHVAPRERFSVVRLGIELEPRVRFDGDPWTAERLAASMKACEGRAPGAAERIWTGTVDAIRAGGPR